MGYYDSEFTIPFELFLISVDPKVGRNVRLYQHIGQDQGRPVMRAAQLDAFKDEPDFEGVIELEYDRFGPGLRRPAV